MEVIDIPGQSLSRNYSVKSMEVISTRTESKRDTQRSSNGSTSRRPTEFIELQMWGQSYSGELDSSRCRDILFSFLNNQILPSQHERKQLQAYLKMKSTNAMINGDYQEAERLYGISAQIRDANQECILQGDINNNVSSINGRIAQLTYELNEVKKHKEEAINEAYNEYQKKLDAVKLNQQKVIDEFEELWASTDSLRAYSRPSTKLIELQTQLRMMTLARDYEDAAKLEEYIKTVENEEALHAQANAEKEYRKRRKAIEDIHQEEIAQQEIHRRRVINQIKKHCHKETQRLKTLINRLTIDKETAQRAKPKSLVEMRPKTSSSQQSNASSQKVIEKLQVFREIPYSSLLKLKPVKPGHSFKPQIRKPAPFYFH